MLLHVVHPAVPHARHRPVVDMATAIALVSPTRCIAPFVPTVAMRRSYLFNHAEISPSIVAIAFNYRDRATVVNVDRAGDCYERG